MEHQEKKSTRYTVVEITIAYLLIQAFVYLLISLMPWPIVGYETWGGYQRGRRTPEPVGVFFWGQFIIGLVLPRGGKAFLLIQYLAFALAFLLLGQVAGTGRYGTAVASSTMYTVYWFQFCATALGFIYWRYRKSQAQPWFPRIAYYAIQLAIIWGVSQFRFSFGSNIGNWMLLAFVGQCIGLLFASSRIRIFVAAEILLGVVIAIMQSWLRSGWSGSPNLLFDVFWVVYLLQCAGISGWLLSRPSWFTEHEG